MYYYIFVYYILYAYIDMKTKSIAWIVELCGCREYAYKVVCMAVVETPKTSLRIPKRSFWQYRRM